MKLIAMVFTHKLLSLGGVNTNLPVHIYSNRLEGDINLNGLEKVNIIDEKGKQKALFTLNFVKLRVSFLKRHRETFENWLEETSEAQKEPKKDLMLDGLFERIECYGSSISKCEENGSGETMIISCDKMLYVVELQVLSKQLKIDLKEVPQLNQ